MATRPDEFVLGVDPEAGKDEGQGMASGGCERCHRTWPTVTFRKSTEALRDWQASSVGGSHRVAPQMICDRCAPGTTEADIAEKIDEATTGTIPALMRYVHVEGVESKTNMIAFRFATHVGQKALVVTDLHVWFKGKSGSPEIKPNTGWVYRNVAVVECEAMYVAPSIGSFFASRIKSSYDSERKV